MVVIVAYHHPAVSPLNPMKLFRFLVPTVILLAACSPITPEFQEPNAPLGDDTTVTEDTGGDGDAMTSSDTGTTAMRTIKMTATDWAFSPTSITLKKGEKVSIELTAIEGDHGIGIPDLGVSQRVEPGETVTVAIPTEKVGTFTFFCNVPCGSGHKEMRGTIVIEE
jgi:cytochrome c oxidase subunit 2